jgi:hypothetical protein
LQNAITQSLRQFAVAALARRVIGQKCGHALWLDI